MHGLVEWWVDVSRSKINKNFKKGKVHQNAYGALLWSRFYSDLGVKSPKTDIQSNSHSNQELLTRSS